MKNINEHIKQHFSYLQDGDEAWGDASSCVRFIENGDTPSKGCQLNVKRDGKKLLYYCFSAKCPCSCGSAQDEAFRRIGRVRQEKYTPKAYKLPSDFVPHVPEKHRIFLFQKYGLEKTDLEKFNVGWCNSLNRIVFPLDSGYQARAVGDNKPKWLSNTPPYECYKVVGEGGTVVFVENAISAIKVNKHTDLPAVALLGHNLSDAKLIKLKLWARKNHISDVILWLDPDVQKRKVRKIKNSLTNYIGNVRVMKSDKKPHAVSGKEIKCLIQSLL